MLFVDQDCDGRVTAFKKNNGSVRRADPLGNAAVYKSMLMDIERFIDAAAELYPK